MCQCAVDGMAPRDKTLQNKYKMPRAKKSQWPVNEWYLWLLISVSMYIDAQVHRTKYPWHIKSLQCKVQFRFSEKATNIWKNIRLVVIILSKFQNKWKNFYVILLPSYKILTFQLKKSAFAMVEQKSVLSRILIFIIGQFQFQWNEIN